MFPIDVFMFPTSQNIATATKFASQKTKNGYQQKQKHFGSENKAFRLDWMFFLETLFSQLGNVSHGFRHKKLRFHCCNVENNL